MKQHIHFENNPQFFFVKSYAVQEMLKETLFHKQNSASSVYASKESSLRRTFCNAMTSSNEVFEEHPLQYNALPSSFFMHVIITVQKFK